jgi:protein regulator of cytokinesis 1
VHIQAMYDQLEALWRRMGVEDEAIDGFVEANRGTTPPVIQAYEEELERMIDLKRERMGEFIANARTEIESLWEELMVGEDERNDFAAFADGEFLPSSLVKL